MSADLSGNECGVERATGSLLIDTTPVAFDFETLWAEVEVICRDILTWESSQTASSTQDLSNAVTKAYILVYHLISHPCLNVPRVHFEGKDLSDGQQALAVYLRFRKVVQTHLSTCVLPQAMEARNGVEPLMVVYVRHWMSFLVAVTNLKTIFSSLAPAWNSLGFEENPFERIEDIALGNWAEVILNADIQSQLEDEVAACIAYERQHHCPHPDGEVLADLKNVLAVLPDQKYYRAIFEDTYMGDLRRHFTEYSRGLRTKGIHAYAKEALEAMENETARATKFLTSKKLAVDLLVGILVDENIEFFQASSFSDWMGNWKALESREQIYCVYNLLSRSRCVGLPLLEERFTNAVVEMTAKEIQAVIQQGNPDGYGSVIRAFLGVIKSLRDVVTDAFHEDASMVESMENGLRHGLLVGGRGAIDYRTLAERLAALSTGAFVPAEVRAPDQLAIEDVVCVYFFLPDAEPSAKEVFLLAYQKQLARRLLSGESNPSLEQQALYLLVQVKQSPLLFACRTMLRAISEGDVYTPVATWGNVHYRAAVLASGTWPSAPPLSVHIPKEVRGHTEALEKLVAQKMAGRRVTLAPALSYGTVVMRLPPGSPQPSVRLKVNLLQICILDQLNQKPEWRFEELCARLGSTAKECGLALAPLTALQIVDSEAPLSPGSTVRLGGSPNIPANAHQLTLIPEVTQVELLPSPGVGDTLGAKLRERLPPQAVETRIMKLLKSEGPQSLDRIHEHVTAALSPNFVPRVDLKKALERLLAREFILREEDTQKFTYLP